MSRLGSLIHKQLDRKGFFSILLRSPCMTGSPQFWLDASLRLGAPLSREMSLTQNPVAFLTRTLFLASLSHQRFLVTGKLDLKRDRQLSNFLNISFLAQVHFPTFFNFPTKKCAQKINKLEFESSRTICKQKYTYRTLLALNEEGEEVVDHFKFPSCCVCHQVERTFFCGHIQTQNLLQF